MITATVMNMRDALKLYMLFDDDALDVMREIFGCMETIHTLRDAAPLTVFERLGILGEDFCDGFTAQYPGIDNVATIAWGTVLGHADIHGGPAFRIARGLEDTLLTRADVF